MTASAIRAAVAEHGSQRAAARALGMAESTLRGILKREPLQEAQEAPLTGSKRSRGIITPKAPQNREKAPQAPREMSGVELLQLRARRARRAARARTAEFRRAFRGQSLPIGSSMRVMLSPDAARQLAGMRAEAGRFSRADLERQVAREHIGKNTTRFGALAVAA